MVEIDRSGRAARYRLFDIVQGAGSFREKARAALQVGTDYLGTTNGHLTRIDPTTDHWEVVASTDGCEGQYPAGLEADLETTYCRRTIAESRSVRLHDAPTEGWEDDPAFGEHQLHCYHGTTLTVNDELYGTVCFVSTDPRRHQFSEDETMFAELLTQLLGRELEGDRHRARVHRQSKLISVLNRVLRHNIRNDVTVIRGRVELVTECQDHREDAEVALRTIDDLIDLAEKARELNDTVGTDSVRTRRDVASVVEAVVARARSPDSDASITFAGTDGTAPLYPSFERAVEELVENALAHSGPAPTVQVTVDRVPDAVEVTVTDDGPGLPETERRVLEGSTETPLMHGSGLGLWLVYWVTTAHGGSVAVSSPDDGTIITLSIPHSTVSVPEADQRPHPGRSRYRAAFENASDPMLVLDDEGWIVDGNGVCSEVFGESTEALVGRRIEEFLAGQLEPGSDEHGSITLVGDSGERRQLPYAVETDILPGQHLLVLGAPTVPAHG